jgi:hypothetical protein
MPDPTVCPSSFEGFFRRWEDSGAAERANDSMFLNELCDLVYVPRPNPPGLTASKPARLSIRANAELVADLHGPSCP